MSLEHGGRGDDTGVSGAAGGRAAAGLESIAREARILALTMISRAGMGHPGGSLSQADILVALYFGAMRVDPGNPEWPERDRLAFSKGHASASYYAALALRGYFPLSELDSYGDVDSRLQSHPDRTKTPGVDVSSGSLGQGLSIAVGMALAARMRRRSHITYALLGDGECQSGQIWEAVLAAAHYRLGSLIAVVDDNGMQAKGRCSDIMEVEPLGAKFGAFGWGADEVDGHDVQAVLRCLRAAVDRGRRDARPVVLIAHTVKGKGVSFMENEWRWHNKPPNAAELERALTELRGAGHG